MEQDAAPDATNTGPDSTDDTRQHPVTEAGGVPGAPSFPSPQDFYRAAIQRADIRHILAVLAT